MGESLDFQILVEDSLSKTKFLYILYEDMFSMRETYFLQQFNIYDVVPV